MKKLVKTASTLSLLGCVVMSTPAAVAADSGWFGGFNVGQSNAKIDNERITRQLLGAGFSTSSMANDSRDTAYKLFAGYAFNKNFALEGGYFDLGQFGFRATTVPAGTLSGDIKLKGLNLDAVGMLPITEKFAAFARVGLQRAKATDSFAGTGAVVPSNPSPSKSTTKYKVGLGAQYDFTDMLGLRGEWERYRINDAVGNLGDIDMLSVGLVFRFGGDKSVSTAKAVTPPLPMVAAAPMRVVVPVKVKTEQYCSILNVEYEINQDDIQREEKEKLAVLGTFLQKYPNTTAVVEGHTDDVGTSEHNMQLSQRRAERVVSYLVEDLRIDPTRLTAVGYGETRPIADNSSIEGQRENRRIGTVIACARDIAGLPVAPARITMAMEMEFDPYKSEIEPQYRESLGDVANFLKANPRVTATVEGHAGKFVGTEPVTPALAMQVSQQRAQNVVNYLADNLGVPRSQLSAVAFGQTRRVSYGTTLEGQQENRRVNIIFNYAK